MEFQFGKHLTDRPIDRPTKTAIESELKKNNRDYLHCRQSGNQQHRTQHTVSHSTQHSSYNKMFTFHTTMSLSLPFTRVHSCAPLTAYCSH